MSGRWQPPKDRCRCGRAIHVLDKWCRGCAATEADRVVGRFVKHRDGGCVVPGCRSTWRLEWAHIHGRGRAPRLRWDPENSVTLCHDHHAYFTHNPDAWRDFIDEIRPGLWEDLHGRRSRSRPDLGEIIEEFAKAAA